MLSFHNEMFHLTFIKQNTFSLLNIVVSDIDHCRTLLTFHYEKTAE
jgi:hypothetical protein